MHQIISRPNASIFLYIAVVFHWLIFSQSNIRFLTKRKKTFLLKIGYSSHKRRWSDCSSELSPPGFQRVSTEHADLASNIIPKTHFDFMKKTRPRESSSLPTHSNSKKVIWYQHQFTGNAVLQSKSFMNNFESMDA